MTDPIPSVPSAIPWYKSPQTIGLVTTFVSAAIALFPKVGKLLGLDTPGDVATAVTNIFSVIALIAPVVGTILRARSNIQKITLTQGNADEHNAKTPPLPSADKPPAGS